MIKLFKEKVFRDHTDMVEFVNENSLQPDDVKAVIFDSSCWLLFYWQRDMESFSQEVKDREAAIAKML